MIDGASCQSWLEKFLADNSPTMNAFKIANNHAGVARMIAEGGIVVIDHVRLVQLNTPKCTGNACGVIEETKGHHGSLLTIPEISKTRWSCLNIMSKRANTSREISLTSGVTALQRAMSSL